MTGTASPSIQTATAAYATVRNTLPPASATRMPASFKPSPVSVTTPTMMPAVAVVAATDSTLLPPSSSAASSRRGMSADSERTKLRPMAHSVAKKTARNGVMPDTSSTTISTSGRNW